MNLLKLFRQSVICAFASSRVLSQDVSIVNGLWFVESVLVDAFEHGAVIIVSVCSQALTTINCHDFSSAEAGII